MLNLYYNGTVALYYYIQSNFGRGKMAGFDHSRGQCDAKEVTVVEVRNPVMHHGGSSLKQYTDYEVCIKTTSKAFIIPQSSVRRRYSEFVWLRTYLGNQNDVFSRVKTPNLPPKKLVGKNNPEFIQSRMRGLQKFLRKIIEHNVFLSDKALHLFLQSGMKVKQIENYLARGEFIDNSDALVSQFEKDKKQTVSSALKSISENITIAEENSGHGEATAGASSYGRSSSYSSISTNSLVDSFEAISVSDFEKEDTISLSSVDVLEHLKAKQRDREEEGGDVAVHSKDTDSLDGKSDDENLSILQNDYSKDLSTLQNSSSSDNKETNETIGDSNDSLAECDRVT